MLVNFKEAGIYHIMDFMFRPGVNDVPDASWKKMSEHPHIVDRLKKGSLSVLTMTTPSAKDATKTVEKPVSGIHQLEVDKAVEVVGETMNHELLVDMIKKEERLPVKTAIQAQLRKLDLDDDGKPLAKKEK